LPSIVGAMRRSVLVALDVADRNDTDNATVKFPCEIIALGKHILRLALAGE
jgi:hypothetical protein